MKRKFKIIEEGLYYVIYHKRWYHFSYRKVNLIPCFSKTIDEANIIVELCKTHSI